MEWRIYTKGAALTNAKDGYSIYRIYKDDKLLYEWENYNKNTPIAYLSAMAVYNALLQIQDEYDEENDHLIFFTDCFYIAYYYKVKKMGWDMDYEVGYAEGYEELPHYIINYLLSLKPRIINYMRRNSKDLTIISKRDFQIIKDLHKHCMLELLARKNATEPEPDIEKPLVYYDINLTIVRIQEGKKHYTGCYGEVFLCGEKIFEYGLGDDVPRNDGLAIAVLKECLRHTKSFAYTTIHTEFKKLENQWRESVTEGNWISPEFSAILAATNKKNIIFDTKQSSREERGKAEKLANMAWHKGGRVGIERI